MKQIELSNGGYAPVNDEDYDRLKRYTWRRSKDGYAIRNQVTKEKQHTVYMHREIIDIPSGFECDHIDGDRLNNQRSNLRAVTRAQNCYNTCSETGRSKYKGVDLHHSRWRAKIKKDYKTIHIGHYSTEEEAALAYNVKARELFGEYARLNIIKKKKPPAVTDGRGEICTSPNYTGGTP